MRTLTPILFLVVAGCFGVNAKQGEPKKGEKEKAAEAKEAKIVRPGQPVVYDGVKVELVASSKDKHLPYMHIYPLVIVKVTNQTKSEIITFNSWLKDESAIVTDEFGNRYKTFHRSHSGGRIDPDQFREEQVYFDKPQAASKEITLKLPGENINRKDIVVCKFPVNFAEQKK